MMSVAKTIVENCSMAELGSEQQSYHSHSGGKH